MVSQRGRRVKEAENSYTFHLQPERLAWLQKKLIYEHYIYKLILEREKFSGFLLTLSVFLYRLVITDFLLQLHSKINSKSWHMFSSVTPETFLDGTSTTSHNNFVISDCDCAGDHWIPVQMGSWREIKSTHRQPCLPHTLPAPELSLGCVAPAQAPSLLRWNAADLRSHAMLRLLERCLKKASYFQWSPTPKLS